MKKAVLLLTFICTSIPLFAQTTYVGFIDKYPIELVTDASSDGSVSAIYCYSNFDTPIVIDGTLKNGKLTFFEKDNSNKNTASLQFDNFDLKTNTLEGIWTDLKTLKKLPIVLNKSFEIKSGDEIEWTDKEILQPTSLDNKYFKLVLSKTKDSYYATVSGIKIFEKKTDRLLQKFNVNCQLWGLHNITIDDYNFDGIIDFSIFESSYAGANTSSLYFLYDPKAKQYFESDFSGVSLEFDSHKKRIFERNQCCAGSIVTTAEYKVIRDKMVLLNEHCYKWDEKKGELVERKMKECQ